MPKAPRKSPPRAEAVALPINNVPEIGSIADVLDRPDNLEIYRLRNVTEHLEQIIKIQNQKIEAALEIIAAEIHYYRTGLKTNVWETYGELQRRLHKLEGQLHSLLDSTNGPAERKKIKTKWGEWIIIFAIASIFAFDSAIPDGVVDPDRLPRFEVIEDKKWRELCLLNNLRSLGS